MRLPTSFAWAATAAAITLAGCASQPTTSASTSASTSSTAPSSTAPSSSAPAVTPTATAPSMQIPAEAAKRLVLNMQLSPQHARDSGWASFKKEWHDITKEQAATRGVDFAMQEGDAKPSGDAGTLVIVKVNDYKHVGIGARIMFGVMTGNAYIDAQVEFRDLATGKLYGERVYNTASSAWQGVFAAVTPKQIYSLADQLLMEMKRL
jgi:hypothetical protein